jgi:hypothetical protein
LGRFAGARSPPLLSSQTHLIFVDVLEQAERVQASLAGLGAQATRAAPEDAHDIRSFVGELSAALIELAGACRVSVAGAGECEFVVDGVAGDGVGVELGAVVQAEPSETVSGPADELP